MMAQTEWEKTYPASVRKGRPVSLAEALQVLEALSDEFDRYDELMAESGRGHCDHGLKRDAARATIMNAKHFGLL